jgi:hypothetical protein
MKAAPKYNFPPDVPIWVDPERLSGAPCFKGTRVPVDSLFTTGTGTEDGRRPASQTYPACCRPDRPLIKKSR